MKPADQLREYPLSIVAVSFLTGFAVTSGLSGVTVTALGVMSKNPTVKRVAVVAWPILRSALQEQVKNSNPGVAKSVFERVMRTTNR